MKSTIKIPLLGLVAMTCVGGVRASEQPNFSGDWHMNAAKTDYRGYPGPAVYHRTITHVGDKIIIVSEQSGGAGDGINTLSITTDGKPLTVDVNGTSTVATVECDGSALIATTVVASYGVEFRDRMSISEDGKELISVVEIKSTQGVADLRIVFDRQ
jgi:hypothetical protein